MDRYQETGNYLVWTEGEYSDYQWNAFFRVLKDFDMVELVEEWARHIGISFDKTDRFTPEWGVPRGRDYLEFIIYSKNMYDIKEFCDEKSIQTYAPYMN